MTDNKRKRRFAAPGDPGPYYLNIKKKQALPAQGPGDKMSEQYANIVFDEYYRPSDRLEDWLSKLETKMVRGLDSVIATGVMDGAARADIAMLLAVQACRYPERFSDRLDLGKYLAIALNDCRSYPNAVVLNGALRRTGMLPGADINDEEFTRLQGASAEDLASELNMILTLHGYEAHFNPHLIISAARQVASHILGLQWRLLHSVFHHATGNWAARMAQAFAQLPITVRTLFRFLYCAVGDSVPVVYALTPEPGVHEVRPCDNAGDDEELCPKGQPRTVEGMHGRDHRFSCLDQQFVTPETETCFSVHIRPIDQKII